MTTEDLKRLELLDRIVYLGKSRIDPSHFIHVSGAVLDDRGRAIIDSAYNRIYLSTLRYCYNAGIHLGHMGPPGLGKSLLTRAFLVWLIGNDPALTSVVVSAEIKIARRVVTRCRNIVLRRVYREIFPEAKADQTKGRRYKDTEFHEDADVGQMGWTMSEWYLQVTGGQAVDPTMAADSVTPRTEGRHPQILYCDDAISRTVAESEAMLNDTIGAFFETWLEGRMSEAGWVIVNHNCWRRDDLLHRLRTDERFCSLWMGVNDACDGLFVRVWNPPRGLPLLRHPEKFEASEIDPQDGADIEYAIPLPPDRKAWTTEFLRQRERANPTTHRKLYQLIGQSTEDLMFPSWPNRQMPAPTPAGLLAYGCRETTDRIPLLTDAHRLRYALYGGLDWSGGKRRGKALTFVAQDKESHRILPVYHARIKTTPDRPGHIQAVVDLLNALWGLGLRWTILHCEDNATQDELNDAVRTLGRGSEWVFTIVPFTTTSTNKLDPEKGLPSIETRLSTGQLVWCSGMAAENPDWALLEHEMAELPRYIEKGKTPDGPMSLWFALYAIQAQGGTINPDDFHGITLDDSLSLSDAVFDGDKLNTGIF